MDLIEFNTHSFVIKVWREDQADEREGGEWRGHITHVPSGERRYLRSLNGIVAFIVPYLASMGVRMDPLGRVLAWLGGGGEAASREPQPALHLEE